MYRFSWMIFVFCFMSQLWGQQNVEVLDYINQFKEIAILEMKRTGVPASITLAQGILESNIGKSKLAKIAKNHFGIKCKNNWSGETMKHTDDERNECFRKYNTSIESYIDHSEFLHSRPWYNFLFTIEPTDYKAWAWGLKKAGYATNKNYALSLIKLIENYKLNKYTLKGLEHEFQFSGNTSIIKGYESFMTTVLDDNDETET